MKIPGHEIKPSGWLMQCWQSSQHCVSIWLSSASLQCSTRQCRVCLSTLQVRLHRSPPRHRHAWAVLQLTLWFRQADHTAGWWSRAAGPGPEQPRPCTEGCPAGSGQTPGMLACAAPTPRHLPSASPETGACDAQRVAGACLHLAAAGTAPPVGSDLGAGQYMGCTTICQVHSTHLLFCAQSWQATYGMLWQGPADCMKGCSSSFPGI